MEANQGTTGNCPNPPAGVEPQRISVRIIPEDIPVCWSFIAGQLLAAALAGGNPEDVAIEHAGRVATKMVERMRQIFV